MLNRRYVVTTTIGIWLGASGYGLHPLKGNLKGHWSIWVNGNWRVTFRFVGADVELVDYQDHH